MMAWQGGLLGAVFAVACVTVVVDDSRIYERVQWNGYPFNDYTLSWKERVNDLVSRLTIDEITDQMANGGRMTFAPGIPRLGISPYPWGSECLRGDVQAGPATSFPQALGLAATFRCSY